MIILTMLIKVPLYSRSTLPVTNQWLSHPRLEGSLIRRLSWQLDVRNCHSAIGVWAEGRSVFEKGGRRKLGDVKFLCWQNFEEEGIPDYELVISLLR